MTLKIGSLFSGYGGLDAGVSSVLDAETVWFSEYDKGPSKILSHRFPGVPNHGDITTIQWVPTCGAYEFEGCGQKAEVLPDRSGWQCHRCQKLWPTALGKVYWPEVPEPVDILTGGSPCQDLSHAGARKGMTEGTRSNLWVAMREAIAQLRPGLVVWENVGGAFSANADSEVEPCAGCVGDGSGPVLRALGRVLGDLASLGFDAEWTSLRAADVGAPHGRLRVFVVAYPAGSGGREGRRLADGFASDRGRSSAVPDQRGSGALLPTPRIGGLGDNPSERRRNSPGLEAVVGSGFSLLPTPRAGDGEKGGPNQAGSSGDLMLPSAVHRLLPTPSAADGSGAGRYNSSGHQDTLPGTARLIGETDASTPEGGSSEGVRDVREAAGPQEVRERQARGSDGLPQAEELLAGMREHADGGHALGSPVPSEASPEADLSGVRDDRAPARTSPRPELGERRPSQPGDAVCLMPSAAPLAGGSRGPCGCGTAWGQYEAAIRRWEQVLGHCAPPPTELGPKGNPRLSARFSEFMMGLPAGWVTDVPGITRNEALKALGNGVCPQQCAAALRLMLGQQVAA